MPTESLEYQQLLHRNVKEYIVVRWCICGILLLSLLAVYFDWGVNTLGLRLAGAQSWLGAVAVTLLVANVVFTIHQRSLTTGSHTGVMRNLMAQIAIDLLVITVVVQKSGTIGTGAAFLYLPHVVLSCMFFSRRVSVVILLGASFLFIGCVLLENAGLMPFHYMFVPVERVPTPTAQIFHCLCVMVLWGMIWTLVSKMSGLLHDCFSEIEQSRHKTENTLDLCQEQMRYTAHQMKAPLVAVQSNLMLLQHEMGGDIPDRIKEILDRTDKRCVTLNQQIYDILNLARLKAGEEVFASKEQLSMQELLQLCIDAHSCNAIERGITVAADLNDFSFFGNKEALRMLLENLVSNAINYSHDNGTVDIAMNAGGDPPGTIRVGDHGIGMSEKDRLKMFDDFYRSPKAKQHCRHSTGMGMAIVKQVMDMYEIGIEVTSALGEGTEIALSFPVRDVTPRQMDPAAIAEVPPPQNSG